jgi:hypothetical protein
MTTKASLTIQQIDINSIRCQWANIYEAELVAEVARSIIATGGLIRLLIVTRRKEGGYELVEGVLEYYAAVKAYEITANRKFVHSAIANAPAKLPASNQVQLLNSQLTK